jgi:glutathione synthase/RimK-type ligase-like ATP-grasp enzyme
MKTILIITEKFDPTADSVIQILNERKYPLFRWNLDAYPQGSTLTYRASEQGFDGEIAADGRTVSFNDIGTVWCRASRATGFSASLNLKERESAVHETESVINSLSAVSRWRWVNEPRRDSVATRKPTQLSVARRIGLKIPRTVITNDPDAAKSFYEKCGGRTVYKSLSPALNLEEGKLLFTNLLTDEKLAQIDLIQHTPGIFQELIEKDYEIRLTVVGERMFAAKIYSQENERSKIDCRLAALDLKHEAVDLPADICAKVSAFMAEFGLVYSCLDFIVTPGGEHIFFENNPRGQYLWIEHYTGMPITEAIADELTAGL